MELKEADREQMEQVLRLSHALWSEGMSPRDYIAYNLAQKDSPWGRERYRFLVGLDRDGVILSSLKLYTLLAEIGGRGTSVAAIGAVFTPRAARGRGHAAAMVRGALDLARAAGQALALLTSEIGEAYYARLGFRTLPSTEAACRTTLPAPWPREPAWTRGGDPFREVTGLRPFAREDLDSLMAIRRAADSAQRFRIVRDRLAWDHALMKIDLGHRLRRDGADRIWVIERGCRIVAYAILKESSAALLWREHAALPGADGTLVDLFWSALAWARARGMARIQGWWLPSGIAAGKLYPVARRPRADSMVMLRALDPAMAPAPFAAEEECRLGALDSC